MTFGVRRQMNTENRNNVQNIIPLIKKQILEHGLLCCFVRFCWWVIKNIWCFLIYRRKENLLDDVNAKRWIFEKWEEDWNMGTDDKEDPFYQLFKYDYNYTCKKIKKNKRSNFRMKFICILPILIATILFLCGICVYNIHVFVQSTSFSEFIENNNWNFSIFSTALYAVAIILTIVTSKWLDVKKYQETWSRHAAHKYAIDMEMFKYIMRMENYSHIDRKKYFAMNIINTWDINENKFLENMKKENKMDDMLENMKIRVE